MPLTFIDLGMAPIATVDRQLASALVNRSVVCFWCLCNARCFLNIYLDVSFLQVLPCKTIAIAFETETMVDFCM